MMTLNRTFVAGLLLVSLNGGAGWASAVDEAWIFDCMGETGYAFAGGSSPISFDGERTYLFGEGPDRPVDCVPFQTGGAAIGAGSNLGSIQYFAGIGMAATTIASHTPESSGTSGAGLATELVLKFRVVPDDPQATGPIQIDIMSRFEIIDLQQEATGQGYGSNSLTPYIRVTTYNPQGPGLGSGWLPNLDGIVEGSIVDFHELRDAPVNINLFLRATATQFSSAYGVPPPVAGSGAAAMTSEDSFEVVAVNDDATIIWGIEEELGLGAPTLGEVPEPSFASALLIAAGVLASIFARSRKKIFAGDQV